MKRTSGDGLCVEPHLTIFEDRFARCRRLLCFVAVRILGSQDEAENAVRSCLAAASRNQRSFESDGAFHSWIMRILIREASTLLHRKQLLSMESPSNALRIGTED